MKRMRDDVHAGSQFKRPFGSSLGESYGQPQIPGGGGGIGGGDPSQKLTTNDALTYLKEVKDMFQDQREKYDMFLEVMKDFKAQRTDTTGVIARVKELFKGHNNLIFGFNTFLPRGYEITLDEDGAPPKKTVEFEEAISFVNKIKKHFQSDDHVYKSFLDILNMYRKEHKDIGDVYNEVAALFEDHPDFLEEFRRFLPDSSATHMSHIPYGRSSIQFYNDRSFATPSLRHAHMDKHRRRDRIITSHADRDLSVDHPELDEDKAMLKVHKEQNKRAERESRDWRNYDQDDREAETNRDLEHIADRKKSARKVDSYGANSNLPSFDERDTSKNMYSQAFIFCEKVKERLHSLDDYQAFLRCLSIYSKGIIKRNDLLNLVTDLLGKYPDLMEEFNDFLEHCENLDGFLAGVMSKKSLCTDGHVSRSLKADEKDKEHKRELESAKEKDRGREKYLAKSIQELDLSNCERCTPSYRLLPVDYPIAMASQRSGLGAQVLNDHWVSVTSGSEDYSFKHMRRNQYEESLFRCEDDRFELDMLLESVSSTAKRAEELLNKMNENYPNLDSPIRMEDYFTALNLRCIERLYGDHGLDAMDILRKNPTLALPVILTRLKQKQEEWARCRSDFNKVWADIYAKNHYKSLDHRSFYFKQQDSKNLNGKSLVTEIKELKEKLQKEDDVILAFAAGNKQHLVPHFEYEYSDVSIHEELYKLVQYSCKEVCSTKEQLNKVMRFWTTFLLPMLGVPSWPYVSASSADVGKANDTATNVTASSIEEGDGSPALDAMTNSSIKPATHVDGCSLLGLAKCSSMRLANGDTMAKEESMICVNRVWKSDVTSDNQQLGRQEKNTDMTDRISGYSIQIASVQVAGDSSAPLTENSHRRTSAEVTAGRVVIPSPHSDDDIEDHKLKARTDIASSSKGEDAAKPILPPNGVPTNSTKVNRYHEDAAGPAKIEKEEGELSPIGDFEEDNFAVYENTDVQVMPKGKDLNGSRQQKSGKEEGLCCQDTGGNDADADDEDSENASEAGDDVSSSESADDECSREEIGEEEDVEHDEIDGKGESEGEAEGMADTQFLGGGDSSSLPSERFLLSVKPVAKHIPSGLVNEERKDSRVLYGNDDFYILFRLHQTLYERILSAKKNSTGVEMKWRNSKDADSPDPYARFMSVLYNLLDGSADNAKFEDECRAIIGNQSYVLFTLDKLIYKLVKQLQTVATDEMGYKLLQLCEYEKSRQPGKMIDSVYYENARSLLQEENIFRFECSSAPSRLSIQLMDNATEKPEALAVSMDPDFGAYLYNDFLPVFPGKKEPHGIIMRRNMRKYVGLDEYSAICMATEGATIFNGLECKIACSSYKISYVLDTEDFFFRLKRKRRNVSRDGSFYHDQSQSRVQRFVKFLSAS
ncbi:paired amphipathic helix protein Sin3-like 2 isoform X2 [Tripterygium wilfordii]|uniref:paired amphipathic helix protein Sin3-like 2 isoform X2 n=1 Tax=Tripterygium wilfordii TaxID=458696 RepID=UPI0018F7E5EF|nr:paired amphipathic helix protein Sin3-like 2 isoform X2 [Tripterygium wilfordii]XP_038703905.1 paired amphipathic helix protein Sin3-like 2 isoform X2 [Tripterygium wilfordii]XP_038703906.1 paired amphipathic helix protein Sin3-like 2 isoform X2 [Tripterygium wilfordii]XP_038703907.1 paired amphipathic helix protein Sin3-like 2 isoform X2 [Tripterygium wilfordii]